MSAEAVSAGGIAAGAPLDAAIAGKARSPHTKCNGLSQDAWQTALNQSQAAMIHCSLAGSAGRPGAKHGCCSLMTTERGDIRADIGF